MSEKLPRITASEVIKVLEKAGFSFSRQSGSHKIYKNQQGNRSLSFRCHSSSKGLEKHIERCRLNG
ncbi:MAG: type II toxin-antitoxin system HicA family toxin [Melioribacteraceae bacterium]